MMSVPSLELGPPHPLPLELRGGGAHTCLRVRGCRSSNSDDWRESLQHSVYSVDTSL